MKKVFRFIKEYYKTIGSVLVVLALVFVCVGIEINKKLQKTTELGRMVQLTPLYKDAPQTPHYYKVAYNTLNIDAGVAQDGTIRDTVGAYTGTDLTEQQQKDKAALEALLATYDEETSTAKAESQERRQKYKKNQLGDANASTDLNITARPGVTAGGPIQYGTGAHIWVGSFLPDIVHVLSAAVRPTVLQPVVPMLLQTIPLQLTSVLHLVHRWS